MDIDRLAPDSQFEPLTEEFPGLPDLPLSSLVTSQNLQLFLVEQSCEHSLVARSEEIRLVYLSIISNSVKEFAENIEFGIQSEDYSLETFMPHSLSACEVILENLFPRDPSGLKENILKLCTLVLRDMEDMFTLLVNAWLGFFVSDFWSFVELGVSELEVFTVYLYEKYKVTFDKYPSLKIFASAEFAERLQTHVSDMISGIGRQLWLSGLAFKEDIKKVAMDTNEHLSNCLALTPQICLFEAKRLRLAVQKKRDKLEARWSQISNCKGHLLRAFLSELLEHLETAPTITYYSEPLEDEAAKKAQASLNSKEELPSGDAATADLQPGTNKSSIGHAPQAVSADKDRHKASTEASGSVKKFPEELILPKSAKTHQAQASSASELPKNQPAEINMLELDDPVLKLLMAFSPNGLGAAKIGAKLTDVSDVSGFSKEELDICRFLEEHPEFNELRQERRRKLEEEVKQRKVLKIDTLVNNKGGMARSFLFDDGLEVLVRKDKQGKDLITQRVRRGWQRQDGSSVDESDTFFVSIRAIQPNFLRGGGGLNDYFTSIQNSIITQMSTIGLGYTSGAFGELLWACLEKKRSFTQFLKDVFKRSGHDLVMLGILNVAPWLAVGLGIGALIMSLNPLIENKGITNDKKTYIIMEIINRSLLKTGISISATVLGMTFFPMILPIPAVLGGFIGGTISGFCIGGFYGISKRLAKNEVILEGLVMYILWMIDTNGWWISHRYVKGPLNMVTFEKYFKTIWKVSQISPLELEKLCKERHENYHRMMEAIYEKLADDSDVKGKLKQVQKSKKILQTAICYGIVSYFFRVYTYQCRKLLERGLLQPEEYLEAFCEYFEISTIERIAETVAKEMPLLGEKDVYNNTIISMEVLVANQNLKCLFRPIPEEQKL